MITSKVTILFRRSLVHCLGAFLCICVLSFPIAHGQNILYDIRDDNPGDRLWHAERVGDINSDGFDDFIVGFYRADPDGLTDAGLAKVYSGATGEIIWVFKGSAQGDGFGHSVAGVGDVNADGVPDFAVSAPFRPNNAVQVKVFSGHDGSVVFTLDGDPNSADGFVEGAGDVNADGFSDIIVGHTDSDMARVYSGIDGGIIYTFTGIGHYGQAVSGVGDVNGDGFGDVIVGSRWHGSLDDGYAEVFSGADGSLLYSYDNCCGTSHTTDSAGDVNQDGLDDFIIGSMSAYVDGIGPAGTACVYSGIDGEIIYTFQGIISWDGFGRSVSGGCDVDGDSVPDIAVTAAAGNYLKIFSGATGNEIRMIDASTYGNNSAEKVEFAGDVNGDGYADFIYLDLYADLGGNPYTGQAYVISGAPDPVALISELINFVVNLNLKNGISNSLDSKLDTAIDALTDTNQNNNVAAINALQAFINHTEAQSGNQIPQTDADTLIAQAEQITNILNSN